MAASFRFVGGSCCCCNDLYRSGVQHMRIKTPIELLNLISSSAFDFDPKNKLMLLRPTSTTIRTAPDDLSTSTLIHTVVGSFSINNRLACNPSDQKVYYMTSDSPADNDRFIRRVNYDGSGDTAIISKLSNGAGGDAFIVFCNATQQLFYAMEPAAAWYIGRCEADGSGDTTLYTPGAGLSIEDMELDNRNRKLLWIEEDFINPLQYWIKRSDLDGSNIETLRTGPLSTSGGNWRFEALQYSAKNDLIYWFEYDSNIVATNDTVGGLFSMNTSGGNVTQLITRKRLNAEAATGNMGNMRLGCGYETTGTASLG